MKLILIIKKVYLNKKKFTPNKFLNKITNFLKVKMNLKNKFFFWKKIIKFFKMKSPEFKKKILKCL